MTRHGIEFELFRGATKEPSFRALNERARPANAGTRLAQRGALASERRPVRHSAHASLARTPQSLTHPRQRGLPQCHTGAAPASPHEGRGSASAEVATSPCIRASAEPRSAPRSVPMRRAATRRREPGPRSDARIPHDLFNQLGRTPSPVGDGAVQAARAERGPCDGVGWCGRFVVVARDRRAQSRCQVQPVTLEVAGTPGS
jgi:hypothetical protein